MTICVPIVVILLDLAVGTEIEHRSLGGAFLVVVEEIGIGLATGLILTAIAMFILRLATQREWISAHWRHVPVVALAALCFASAQALRGSGFIACFVGGLLFGYPHDRPYAPGADGPSSRERKQAAHRCLEPAQIRSPEYNSGAESK